MKEKCLLKNEDGSILAVALIMLVLLTLLGIYATTTSEIEIQIAGNEKLSKQNLYQAEAASMECAQDMEDNNIGSLTYILAMGSGVTENDIKDPNNACWNSSQQSINSNTRFLTLSEGIAPGTSIGIGGSQVHAYTIYGRRYNPNLPHQGRSIVKVGFRKAF